MLFWLIVVTIVSASLAAVVAPLWRNARAGAGRASHDMHVLRDQLREIDADMARGLLTTEEAAATRTEVSRRLLAAADAEATESRPMPAPPRIARAAALAVMAAAGLGAVGLYARLGVPGLPDQPRAVRMAAEAEAHANRPGQDEAEAARGPEAAPAPTPETPLVDRLATAVAGRPQDIEGHRLLARSLAALGRFPEARRAQARVIALEGAAATGADYVALSELMVRAADGYVSPEAEAALRDGLTRDPENPLGRYLSGIALLQAGRPDLAHPIWSRLLDEGADGPWLAPIATNIDAVAAMAGLPPRAAPRGPVTRPGPDAAAVEAAGAMNPAARAEMIGGMVARLQERLAAEGGPPEDWAQLVRSLRILGRADEAAAVAAEAETAFAGDLAAQALVAAAAETPAAAETAP